MYYGSRPVNAPLPKGAPINVRRLSQQQWKRRSSEIQDWEKQLNSSDVEELKDLFNYFDRDKSGYIDWKELRLIFEELGQKMSDRELQEMINDVDGNKNGQIDWDEFLLVIQTMRMYASDADKINESKLKELSTLMLQTSQNCATQAIYVTEKILEDMVHNCLRDHQAVRSQRAKNLLKTQLELAKDGVKSRMSAAFGTMSDEVTSALRGEAKRHKAGVQASRAASFLQAVEKVLALRAQQKSMEKRHMHLTQHIRDELEELETQHREQMKTVHSNNQSHDAELKCDHAAALKQIEEDHQKAMNAMEDRREGMKAELMDKISTLRKKIADMSLAEQRTGLRSVAQADGFKALMNQQQFALSKSSTPKEILSLTKRLEDTQAELDKTKENLHRALQSYRETNEGKAEARARRIHKHRFAALEREFTAIKNELVLTKRYAAEVEDENGVLFQQLEATALAVSRPNNSANQNENTLANFDAVVQDDNFKLNAPVGHGYNEVREIRIVCTGCRSQKTVTKRERSLYSKKRGGKKNAYLSPQTPLRHTSKSIGNAWGTPNNTNTRQIRINNDALDHAGLYVHPEAWSASPASATAVWRERRAQKERAGLVSKKGEGQIKPKTSPQGVDDTENTVVTPQRPQHPKSSTEKLHREERTSLITKVEGLRITAMKRFIEGQVRYGIGEEYWEIHYKQFPEPFDWLQKYSALKEIMSLYMKRTDNILVVGCGNARFSEDLYDDGYEKITNIDTCKLVIMMMREKYRDRPTLIWEVKDVCDMILDTSDNRKELSPEGRIPPESIDTILMKGTFDVMCCGENYEHHIDQMLTECSKMLRPKGILILISCGLPGDPAEYGVHQGNRLAMLEKEEYLWDEIRVHAVPKQMLNLCAVPDTSDPTNMHYMYVCRKVEVDPRKDIEREKKMARKKDPKWDPNK